MSTTTGDDSTIGPLSERSSTSPQGASAPEAVEAVLSAERVDIAVHPLPRERVRLRREIHTREVEVQVTVRREVLRIERVPVKDGGVVGPTAGATAPAEPLLDLVLLEERPVVGLEVVPYERVRIGVDAVRSTSRVDTTAAREVVDITSTLTTPATITNIDAPSTASSNHDLQMMRNP